jgi:hypothetical protein
MDSPAKISRPGEIPVSQDARKLLRTKGASVERLTRQIPG